MASTISTATTKTMTMVDTKKKVVVFDFDRGAGGPRSPLLRPRSPKLGDFTRIFDMGLVPRASILDFVKPSSRPRSPILPDLDESRLDFFDGFDISTLTLSPKRHDHKSVSPISIDLTDNSPANLSILSTLAPAENSTPATTPPSSSERDLNKGSAFSEQIPQAPQIPRIPKPYCHVNSETGLPTDNIPGSERRHVAYWDSWKAATPGYLTYEAKFEQLRVKEYERIVRLQHKIANLPWGKTFTVPWSPRPALKDGNSYIATVPWQSSIGAHVGPKPVSHSVIDPLYQVPKDTQLAILRAACDEYYQKDVSLRRQQIAAPNGRVHIFVDMSNIIIGFYDCIKMKRGFSLADRTKAPPFFFEAFASVLERRRGCAKRVLAGSIAGGAQPGYILEANQCGYETHIMQRVLKPAHKAQKKTKKTRKGNFYDTTTSGGDSSEDSRKHAQPLKHGEQGVDELLHLKITQSILDEKQPSTMVIATGDAAEAEFSDGFLKNAERALERGWYVELVAWNKGISSAWRSPEFSQKWGDQFRIIELDSVVEELLGWYLRRV